MKQLTLLFLCVTAAHATITTLSECNMLGTLQTDSHECQIQVDGQGIAFAHSSAEGSGLDLTVESTVVLDVPDDPTDVSFARSTVMTSEMITLPGSGMGLATIGLSLLATGEFPPVRIQLLLGGVSRMYNPEGNITHFERTFPVVLGVPFLFETNTFTDFNTVDDAPGGSAGKKWSIDLVSVVPVSPVPEPSSWALIAISLLSARTWWSRRCNAGSRAR